MDYEYTGTNEVGSKSNLEFGMELIVDLYQVDAATIRNKEFIERFAVRLVNLIGMKAFGPPQVVHFGHADPVTSGYTLVQLIETSSITAHFSEGNNTAHINVFSCQWFEAMLVMHWIVNYFGATRVRYRVIPR